MSQPDYYPIFLDLTGRRVLVIGGGNVAEGKVQRPAGGQAPTSRSWRRSLTPALRELDAAGRYGIARGEYDDGDLEGYDVCFVATDDGAVNAARRRRGPRAPHLGQRRRRPGELRLHPARRRAPGRASSSPLRPAATSPALARRLREDLTAFLGEDYAPLARPAGRGARRSCAQRGLRSRRRDLAAGDRRAACATLVAQRRIEDARSTCCARRSASSPNPHARRPDDDAQRCVIGTRGSALARRQVEIVDRGAAAHSPGVEIETRVIRTEGDRRSDVSLEEIGGQGVFVKDIEARLLRGEIDLAVHSLKDMPAESPEGLTIGAVLPRGDVRDALVGRRTA